PAVPTRGTSGHDSTNCLTFSSESRIDRLDRDDARVEGTCDLDVRGAGARDDRLAGRIDLDAAVDPELHAHTVVVRTAVRGWFSARGSRGSPRPRGRAARSR